MRTLGLVLVVACSSNGGGGGGDDGSGIDAPTGVAEACSDSVQHYCSTVRCDGTSSDAHDDATLCPSDEITCLDVDIVVSTTPDGGENLYYRNGVLVAIEDVTIAGSQCVAGPAMFAPPNCGSVARTSLPVCVH